MEFSRAATEAFCFRMTNKSSVLRNNIPVHVVKLSVMQLSRRHTDKLFNKGVVTPGLGSLKTTLGLSSGHTKSYDSKLVGFSQDL